MPLIKKNITLEDYRDLNTAIYGDYKVKKLINSTEFQIDHFISKKEVDSIIIKGWVVNIIRKVKI